MRSNSKINIFLKNNKWLDKKSFNTQKNINNFVIHSSKITLNECFLLPKFKKLKKLKIKINFILADDKFLEKLNTFFLNKKKPTNVLSFPNENFSKNHDGFLGEVFLSYETCKKEAKKFKINFKDRIGHLVVHGILHLLGYDHKTKVAEKKMVRMESKILNLQGINYY